MSCPNINAPEFKALIAKIGFKRAFEEFVKNGDNIPNADLYQESLKGIDAVSKTAKALVSDKAQVLFKRFYESNPDKFYTELTANLGATKPQVEQLRALNERTKPTTVSEMVANLLAETTFTVRLEVAMESNISEHEIEGFDTPDGWSYSTDGNTYYRKFLDDDSEQITKEAYDKANIIPKETAATHYGNLTVPGGINYRENRIVTPAIEPTIKGHAQFAQKNDIGWFRSDDRSIARIETGELESTSFMSGEDEYYIGGEDDSWFFKNGKEITKDHYYTAQSGEHKTRRILELQSDLFQKGRNKEVLTVSETDRMMAESAGMEATRNSLPRENAFLQILNTDNAWVHFFVQSIIQDSINRGYEKIHFPAGDTAAKIEGHQTLSEYIKFREERLAKLEPLLPLSGKSKTMWAVLTADKSGKSHMSSSREETERLFERDKVEHPFVRDNPNLFYVGSYEEKLPNYQGQYDQFKRELDDAHNGRTTFSAINRFYETDVQNVLKKRGFNPTRITDEHGNDWFEIESKPNFKETIFFNREIDDTSMQFLQGQGLVEQHGDKYIAPSSDQAHKIDEYNQKYYLKNGVRPFIVTQTTSGAFQVEARTDVQKIGTSVADPSTGIIHTVMNRLQKVLGVEGMIISDVAAKELLGKRYNGESAFYFKGKVYLIADKLSTLSTVHEFAHPLVQALRLHNNSAYTNMYKELQDSLDPNVQAVFDAVHALYPEYSANDNAFKDEVMVRVIADVAKNKIEKKGLKTFLERLWFRLKEMFRAVFGDKISISKLNENTSVEELADMLAFGTAELETGVLDEDLFFNRELASELENVGYDKLIQHIDEHKDILKTHIKYLKNHNHEKLRQVLKNESDGSIPQTLLGSIRTVDELPVKELENEADRLAAQVDLEFKKLRAFAEAVIGIKDMSEKMAQHVEELEGTVSEQELLRTLFYYTRMVNDWQNLFKSLGSTAGHKGELGKYFGQAHTNFERIEAVTKRAWQGGVVEVLKEQLTPLKEEADAIYKDRIADLRSKEAAGNTAAKKMADELEALYKRFNLDEPTILEYLAGNMGDTNAFSTILESYTSSPDPIVGGFALYMKKNFMKVESIINELSTRMRFELKDAYATLGISRRSHEEVGAMMLSTDRIPTKNDKGEIVAHEIYSFMNEFHGGWLFDYKRLETALENASTSGDKAEIEKARKEFEDLKRNFFHREYDDAVYKAWEFWDQSDINKEARRQRDGILDEIKWLQSGIDQTDRDGSEQDLDEIEELQQQLRWLRSDTYKDGTPKAGEDLAVAQALQQYSELTKGLYNEYEIKGLFASELKRIKGDIQDKLEKEGKPVDGADYKKRVNDWVRANIRIRLSQEFYDSRQVILDEIERIISKLPKDEATKLSISDKWKEIFTTIKENRDDDGQPIGSDLNEDQIKKVGELQDEIDEIRTTLVRLSGLTAEEDMFLGNYLIRRKAGMLNFTDEEDRHFTELMNKAETSGLTSRDRADLSRNFALLRAFQTKIPTEYYVDVFNEMADKYGIKRKMDVLNADSMMGEDAVSDLFTGAPMEFKNWFTTNHRLVNRWDNELKEHISRWERLYVWNRIVPNDSGILNAFDQQDYESLMAIDHPHFEIKKARKFYFYRIKDEHRTGYDSASGTVKLQTGVHKDNRNNWLPRTDINDSPYINKEYFRLRDSKDPKDQAQFKALEIFKKNHLKIQEDAHPYAKLWYEYPRMQKHKAELLNEVTNNPKGFIKDVLFNMKGAFKKVANMFDRGDASPADVRNETKMYVMTDLFGNELQAIPMKYMSKIEKDNVSLDIIRSLMHYASAIENNKMLHEINPIARALENIVQENGIKDINKMSWFSSLNNVFSKGVKAKSNNRLKALQNMFERDIEGITSKMEIGFAGHKAAQHLMGLAAFGSLAMNIPAGIKNLFSARIQNVLEAVTGKNFSGKDWSVASGKFISEFIPALTKDYNEFGSKSIETQMYELFDPVEGKYLEHLGKEGTQSYIRDLSHMQFLQAPQTFGEINAQGTSWLAMMRKTTVTQTIDGTSKDIPYHDAWEKDSNGVLVLKQGIDPAWGRSGHKFLSFKARMHKVNELLQGAYSTLNQPELARYTLGKLALFMRRFVGPGAVNRFAPMRMNAALGTVRGGYMTQSAKMAGNMFKDLLKTKWQSWPLYSADEKKMFWKTMTEIGYSMMFLLLLAGMGYDDNDKNKNKKVAKYDWARQMMIYELLMIKSETETFIPLPAMGVNELLRMKDNFSIAMPIMNRYKKLFDAFSYWVGGAFSEEYAEKARYQKEQGVWDKGDLKVTAQLLKFFGWTGNTQHPDVAIKNFSMSMNKY